MSVPRPRFTYANIVSTLALTLVLSGAAYAGTQLPKDSVTSKQIKDGSVKGPDIQNGGIKGPDISEASLGNVPSATNASKLGGKPAAAYAEGGSETWTDATLNDGSLFGSQAENYACHWEATDVGVHAPPGFYRDSMGGVHLRGQVQAVDGDVQSCGTNFTQDQIILTLPGGYRPEFRTVLSVMVNSTLGRVNADVNGLVRIEDNFPTYANAEQWLTLDDHSFRCFPLGIMGCP